MKKIFFLASLMLSALAMTGCNDFLDADNKSSVTDQQYFTTKAGFQTLLNNAYESLHDIYASSSYTDYFQAGTDMYQDGRSYIDDALHEYETLTPEQSDMKSLYASCYEGIRKAYAVLYYAPEANIDEATRRSAICQARALAANYYYIMVNIFGGVPLMKEYLTQAEYGYPRATNKEVYEYIIAEMEDVIGSNALKASTAANGGGEFSQEAAYALIAKIYLAAAWDLGNKDYFSKAAQYADKCINGRKLTTPFADLWRGNGSGDDNEEFIWDLEYDLASANNSVNGGNSWFTMYCNHFGGQEDHAKSTHSAFVPTLHSLYAFQRGDVRYAVTFMKELPDVSSKSNYSYWDFYANGETMKGIPVLRYYAAWYETDADIQNWRDEDPENRKDAHILPMAETSSQPQELTEDVVDYQTFVTYSFGGSPVRKFDDANTAMYADKTDYRDIHIISLSEVYLIAAEAYLKAGDASKALDRLNVVHQRAGLEALSNIDIDTILDERICELFGQGSRWIDLRRTQKLVEYNNLYNPQLQGRAAACIGQKLLRPIPQSAIDANENLSTADQNPGY